MFTIKRSVILFIILIVFTSCDLPKSEKADVQSVDQTSLKNAKFQIKTYRSDSGGYGYDIFVNTARMIHQPHIPGLKGVKGFDLESQAEQTANLVINKLRSGIMPPTITEQEIDLILRSKNQAAKKTTQP
ncbi:DUF4907 domain-containing protein [Leptospira interrogans]|uniref:DUF4907 domain-containing protein n=1 Tax=Leptospira interrogans TaxID=173 RepID=UPI0010C0D4FE|nr:DUF4907 domain-containing protein [Leptospira interrogans]KAA1268064.1 DUF4907 domain-containing protein [Leptospira interrogans serovar Weerasinghe]KAA1291304.1 DUF4907 domain-containing protein [Leptospira interrogans serovar Geyaweera]QCO40110.1 DUF4907 domain-containing protein [Leptospira interrogans]ULG81997.1 DUF4907 domain-containing protein [Leptospira interrogans]ULG92437.1 DUF4907 domain-containing protein [Leptospira interrogans]